MNMIMSCLHSSYLAISTLHIVGYAIKSLFSRISNALAFSFGLLFIVVILLYITLLFSLCIKGLCKALISTPWSCFSVFAIIK